MAALNEVDRNLVAKQITSVEALEPEGRVSLPDCLRVLESDEPVSVVVERLQFGGSWGEGSNGDAASCSASAATFAKLHAVGVAANASTTMDEPIAQIAAKMGSRSQPFTQNGASVAVNARPLGQARAHPEIGNVDEPDKCMRRRTIRME